MVVVGGVGEILVFSSGSLWIVECVSLVEGMDLW